MSTLVTLDGVACARGGRVLFNGVSFAVGPVEALWLKGRNGIGKSSLLRLIAGLLEPAAGSIDRAATVALADDGLALDRDLPLEDALAFWARLDLRAPGWSTAAGALGLDPLRRVPVRMLSTGQRRRAVLARMADSGARLWLMDEPFNGLDSDGMVRVTAMIAQHRANGGGVIIASHQDVALPDLMTLTLDRPADRRSATDAAA